MHKSRIWSQTKTVSQIGVNICLPFGFEIYSILLKQLAQYKLNLKQINTAEGFLREPVKMVNKVRAQVFLSALLVSKEDARMKIKVFTACVRPPTPSPPILISRLVGSLPFLLL